MKKIILYLILFAFFLFPMGAYAANVYIGSLTADTAPTTDDLVETENAPGGTPSSRKVTLGNLSKGLVGIDEAYGSGWNADAQIPEKDDIYDYLHQIDTDDDGDADNIESSVLIDGGSDAIDGDKLEITWSPSTITPDTSIAEADSADDLAAILEGFEDYLDALGSGFEPTVTEGSLADSVIISADIKDGEIAEADLKAVDSPTDEDILTKEDTTGDFEWHTIDELIATISEGALPNDNIVEADLKAVDSASDEDILTRETTAGDFEWHTIDELIATISAGALTDASVQEDDLAAALAFDDGDQIDLTGITYVNSATTNEGLALPTYVAGAAPADNKPYAAYDAANNRIMVYESGGWADTSSGTGAAASSYFITWQADGGLSAEQILTAGYGIDVTLGGGDGGAATIAVNTTEISADGTDTWSDNSNSSIVWTFDVSGTDHTMTAGNGLMTFGDAVTVTDTLTASNGIVLGASKAITGSTALTLGGGSETVAISSSDWDIDASGVATNMGNFTSDGTIEGATLTEGGQAVYNATETPGGELGGTFASFTIDDGLSVSSWTLVSPTITTSLTATDLIDSAHYVADSIDNEHINWADIDNLDDEGMPIDFALTAEATVANDIAIRFGSAATDWYAEFDDSADDQMLWHTNADGLVATTDPMFEILVDFDTANGTNMTANQQVFGVSKGMQANNVTLLTLDEDGDLVVNGSISDTNGVVLNEATSWSGDLGGTGSSPTVTDFTITNEAQGDILYFNGSNWVRLAAGTSGHYLKTLSTGNDPEWAAVTATPAGDDDPVGQVQYRESGALAAEDAFYYTSGTNTLIVDNVTSSGTVTAASIASSATADPTWTFADSSASVVGTGDIKVDAATPTYDSLLRLYVDDSAGEDTLYVTVDGTNEEILFAKKIDLTSAGIENVGAIADDGAITLISSGNTVTVESVVFTGGAISSVTTIGTSGDADILGNIELGHATDTTISRSAAATVQIEGNTIITTASAADSLANDSVVMNDLDDDGNFTDWTGNWTFTTGTVTLADGFTDGTMTLDGAGGYTGVATIAMTGAFSPEGAINLGTGGVVFTDDGDGALTILGAGDGYDENLVFNFDDTENEVVVSSGTGVTNIDFGAITLEAGSFISAPSASPGWTFSDSDDVAGTAYIYANSSGGSNDIIMSIGVEAGGSENVAFMEVDGVSETVDFLKEAHFTINATAATFGAVGTDADVVVAFDAVTNQGSITYMEDEDRFDFDNDVDVVADLTAGTVTSDGAIAGTTITGSSYVQGFVMTTLDTDPTVDLSGDTGADGEWRINNDDDVITYTLPPAKLGLSVCFYDNAANGQVITIDPDDGTDYIILDGAAESAGETIVSPGDRGDYICLLGISTDIWIATGKSGTWDGGVD